ncbi:hypothetical protein [Actinophytocola sp.]|uniref:peptidoglycan-binding domain-containing protein n=1 Tax=Actinophytocola sp. TaxID=1872138 RepID=UPI002D80381D|nr:hypothetical protein [Actinophytocola sp.]HET9140341.1 hypothetical protein [Actinophytocola sp.]
MGKTSLKKRLCAGTVVFLTIFATVVVTPVPASANVSQGYVLGVGFGDDALDDWDDEGPLSVSENLHSNVVAMWQQVLWADGLLPWSGIDCWFGSQTAEATRTWKRRNNLDDNGIVGWRALQKVRARFEPFQLTAWTFTGRADGPLRQITFWRDEEIYSMSISGDVHNLGYNYANFDVCT